MLLFPEELQAHDFRGASTGSNVVRHKSRFTHRHRRVTLSRSTDAGDVAGELPSILLARCHYQVDLLGEDSPLGNGVFRCVRDGIRIRLVGRVEVAALPSIALWVGREGNARPAVDTHVAC